MKKIILIATLLATTLTGCGTQTQGEETISLEEIYPRTMTVTDTDVEQDLLILTDFAGYAWEFQGIEDWEVGDICSCIMHTNGTEIIVDDEILSTRYNGVEVK